MSQGNLPSSKPHSPNVEKKSTGGSSGEPARDDKTVEFLTNLAKVQVLNAYTFYEERDQLLNKKRDTVLVTKSALMQLEKMSRYDELLSVGTLFLKCSEDNVDD